MSQPNKPAPVFVYEAKLVFTQQQQDNEMNDNKAIFGTDLNDVSQNAVISMRYIKTYGLLWSSDMAVSGIEVKLLG